MRAPTLVLASASPRRAALLRDAGLPFEIRPADIDERPHPDESAETLVQRLAAAKARAVAADLPARPVLGADTVVVVDGAILGKPPDLEGARRMLASLSGRVHEVLTGVTLVAPGGEPDTRLARTRVRVSDLSDTEIGWYAGTGEGLDKAGGYAIQGLFSRFVAGLDGSYTNVVGLPVSLVYRMCTEARLLLS